MKHLLKTAALLVAAAATNAAFGQGGEIFLLAGTVAPTVRAGTKSKKDGETAGASGGTDGGASDGAPGAKAAGQDTEGALSADEVSQLVGKQVTEAIRQELPKHVQNGVTLDGIKTIIVDVMKEYAKDSKTVTRENLGELVTDVCRKQFDAFRKDNRFVLDPSDAAGTAGGKSGNRPTASADIEIPVSWRKGNLPVHGKQLLNILMKRHRDEGIDAAFLDKSIERGEKTVHDYRSHARQLEQARSGKALTSTGEATGDELVHRDLSSELQRRFYLSSDLAALMMAREIDMPSQPYDFPLSTTPPTFYLESAENTNATGSDPGTGLVTLDAKKLMGMIEFSYELEEDAIIPVLPWVQERLATAAAESWEDALINGDDSATHQDSDYHAISKHAAKAFKGFRKLSLAVTALKSDMTSGGLSESNLRALRKLMKKYGLDPRKLAFIASPTSALELQAIANVTTMDKFGNRATILTGELAALFGIPIIGSEKARENLNATGVYDGVTTTKSAIQIVRLDQFLTGRRRDFTVEIDRNIRSQTHQLVASFRKAFTPIETPSATITSVVTGYNFAP